MALVPASSHGSSSAGLSVSVERLSGDSTNVANGATVDLTWDHSTGPATLLDRTAPQQPIPLTAGYYGVTVSVASFDAVTVGGGYTLELRINSSASPTTNVSGWNNAVSTTAQQYPECAVTLPAVPLVADSALEARVTNYDGTNAVHYQIIGAIVTKLS